MYQSQLIKIQLPPVLTCISLHGDQLFEECVRYVKWTLRDGLDPVERIDGIDTEFEFADWHAKYTLYKVQSCL